MDTQPQSGFFVPVTCPDWVGRALDDLAQALGAADVTGPLGTFGAEAAQLLDHLRAGRTAAAIDLCLSRQPGLARLHLDLFLPILNRLETEWRSDEITFEDISFTFIHLHRVMVLLGLQRRTLRQTGHFGRILVAIVPGEAHAYGAHVLADMVCDAGWRVDLHEPPDLDSLRAMVEGTHYAALCLSVGHDASLHGLADCIAHLRAQSANPRLKVIVGGAGVEEPVEQYQFLGADHVVLSATAGLDVIHRLSPEGQGRERN